MSAVLNRELIRSLAHLDGIVCIRQELLVGISVRDRGPVLSHRRVVQTLGVEEISSVSLHLGD